MKLSLVVLSSGKMEGKAIPIGVPEFLIGRDPDCHIRPASALISKRHCALLVHGERAFVKDFNSTNGTFLNGDAVKGERELKHDDLLRAGPLEFRVRLEPSTGLTPTPPMRPVSAHASSEEDSAAALLLGIGDDAGATPVGANVDSQGIPMGSTVMEIIPLPSSQPAQDSPAPADGQDPTKPSAPGDRHAAAKAASASTSSAAKAILEKYMRRRS